MLLCSGMKSIIVNSILHSSASAGISQKWHVLQFIDTFRMVAVEAGEAGILDMGIVPAAAEAASAVGTADML